MAGLSFCASSALPNWWSGDATTQREGSAASSYLPEAFATDPDRLARFQREAQVLASLNHPNIVQIHGIEEEEGTRALVLELVEGPTLADRIAKGPIPIDEALPIAKQIAEALEAAHEAGVIHRDLKPANIKVREDGTVKVLDFGLAKALDPNPTSDPSLSPTLTAAATQMGVIMGTAAYMSPEQAKGRSVDRRADIWAFGAVLYEMLAGRRAFMGEDVSDTLAMVLMKDVDWSVLPDVAPASIQQLLHRCLERDPKQRIHDIGDVRLAMEGTFEPPSQAEGAVLLSDASHPGRHAASAIALAVAALVVGVFLGRTWFQSSNVVPAVGTTRLSLNVYPGQHLSGGLAMEEIAFALQRPSRRSFALSPDGRQLIYAASGGDTTRLYRRPMAQARATPIPNTEGASYPFFAPDGEAVAFFAGTQLKRVSTTSGEVRTLATSGPEFRPELGASWTADDTILLSSGDVIYELPANGGNLSRLTTGESNQGEQLRYPELLPGGGAVLFNLAEGGVPSEWDIVVEALDTGQRHVVVEGGSDPRYLASGHIVFVRTGTLMAVPFDVTRLEVTGAPVVAVEDVMQSERGSNDNLNAGAGQFSVSHSGVLAVPGGIYPLSEASLAWVDREGASELLPLPPARYLWPRFSPDGTRLAYGEGATGADFEIWVYEIGLQVPVRLTSGRTPVWSPDGTRLAFVSEREGGLRRLYWMAADGSGEPQRFAESVAAEVASAWSPDGVLAFLQDGDIWTVSMNDADVPEPFLETPFDERWPAFSPDGRWLAYTSSETDRHEVYVRPFPSGEPVYRVSTAGGGAPLWSPDGRELFFRARGEERERGIMVVDVTTDATFTRSQPRVLFESRDFGGSNPVRSYDVAPDGERFVMYTDRSQVEQEPVTSINVVLNWVEELKRLAPVN